MPWSAAAGRAISNCRAIWSASCPTASISRSRKEPASDPEALAEAVAEAVRRIAASQKPVIIAGVEIHRFGLQKLLLEFAEGAGIPIVATMLGKSVIGEEHPLFAGIYEGALGGEEVTRFVEESDCIILLGEFMTDINMGIFTANLALGELHLRHERSAADQPSPFSKRAAEDFIRGLADAKLKTPPRTMPPRRDAADKNFTLRPDEPISIRRLIAPLEPEPGRDDRGHRRSGRCALRLERIGHPPPDRVHQPGVLHVDGLCRAGGARGDGRPARSAAGGAGGRRRVPDDRHGAFDDRRCTASARS